jgi:hypothetical protein
MGFGLDTSSTINFYQIVEPGVKWHPDMTVVGCPAPGSIYSFDQIEFARDVGWFDGGGGRLGLSFCKIPGPNMSLGFGQAFDIEGQSCCIVPGDHQKLPCLVLSDSNIVLAGPQVIDGVAVAAGKRVCVAGQGEAPLFDATQNGIYVCQAGAWTRAADMPAGTFTGGVYTEIQSGATYTNLTALFDPGSLVGTDELFVGQGTWAVNGGFTNTFGWTVIGLIVSQRSQGLGAFGMTIEGGRFTETKGLGFSASRTFAFGFFGGSWVGMGVYNTPLGATSITIGDVDSVFLAVGPIFGTGGSGAFIESLQGATFKVADGFGDILGVPPGASVAPWVPGGTPQLLLDNNTNAVPLTAGVPTGPAVLLDHWDTPIAPPSLLGALNNAATFDGNALSYKTMARFISGPT